jgi:uncharacterized membrane protein (DUF106 family)
MLNLGNKKMNKLRSLFSIKGIVLSCSAFFFCYARHIIQYKNPPWQNGFLGFLGSWFSHYIVILLIAVIVLAIVKNCGRYLFIDKEPHLDNIEDTVIHVSLTILAASLLLLFAYYVGPHVYVDDIYE